MEDPSEIMRSIDPGLYTVLLGASRGDRAVLPALRDYLEKALALFIDSKGVGERTSAAVAGKSESEMTTVFRQMMAPLTVFQDLVAAALQLPDPSLEPVLRELAAHVPDDGVLDALEKVQSMTPRAGGDDNVVTLSTPGAAQPADGGTIVKLLREDSYRALKAAVRKASIADLLEGIAECVATFNDFKHDIAAACHRRNEAEILFAVRPWVGHADPRCREAAAWALGREGEEDVPPDRRTMDCLNALLVDREPDVIVAALYGLAQRTGRNFTPSDLERMRQACERHPSVKVRGAYSDAFYSPYVGNDPATGALDVWCRMTRDEDARQRYVACGRLRTFLYEHNRNPGTDYGRIGAALNAARADSSANVRFEALAGLTDLGENHNEHIRAELDALADLLERSGVSENTIDEDNGLNMVNEIVQKPSRLFVPALERIIRALKVEDGNDFWRNILESCRNAPREGWFGRLWPA